ncbi:MAG: glycosyl hydrolase family 18 protein, partial [Imperialibacter sp.]
DFVNIMAYDFYVAGDTVGHHSNLYPSENYEKENSADKAVKTYIEQGVPAEKLVLGVPFYGRSWTMKSSDNLGILRPRDEVMRGNGFTFIKDSLMARPGFVRYWDDAAKSPYLFNAENNQLVVYDDESSVKLKCEYVNDNGLAGIMFWQYASDPKEYLLDVVNENLD